MNSPYIFPVGDSPELVCSVAAVLAIFHGFHVDCMTGLFRDYFENNKSKNRSTLVENICEEFLRKKRFLISASDGIGFFFSRFDSQPNVTSFFI